VQIAIQAEARS